MLYDASSSFVWPGAAAVTSVIVHFACGTARASISSCMLDGHEVSAINSRLRAGPERADALPLQANAGRAFMGGKLVGIGLAIKPEEYCRLCESDPRNRAVLRPYLGGEDVNSEPTGAHTRFMIDFTPYTLDEAAKWPELLAIVEREVKPARMKDNRGTYKTYWWRPGESGGALYRALSGMTRCIVTARVSKHLCFSFQPTSPFFNEKVYVFAIDAYTAFAVLQSRVHGPWVRLLSSTLKTDLNYSASDCFDTFPFPQPDPRSVIPAVEAAGEALYEARARFMVDTNQGLTKTYNALKDPACSDERVLELRRLHEAMDRAVLDAYGWSDLSVSPYCPSSDEEKAQLAAFEDAVIDRLYVLNAERAREEARLGLGKKGKGGKEARKSGAGKRTQAPDSTQGVLAGVADDDLDAETGSRS